MKVKILDICEEIGTGLVVSRKKAKLNRDKRFNYKVLSINNIDDNGEIISFDFDSIPLVEEIDEKYLTKNGDVVIRLSDPFTAIYINEKTEGILIPSTFSYIRLKNNIIHPKYLTIIFNSKRVKNQLRRKQIGTYIATANTSMIASIELKKVETKRQVSLINTWESHVEEKRLLKELIKKKEEFMDSIIGCISQL